MRANSTSSLEVNSRLRNDGIVLLYGVEVAAWGNVKSNISSTILVDNNLTRLNWNNSTSALGKSVGTIAWEWWQEVSWDVSSTVWGVPDLAGSSKWEGSGSVNSAGCSSSDEGSIRVEDTSSALSSQGLESQSTDRIEGSHGWGLGWVNSSTVGLRQIVSKVTNNDWAARDDLVSISNWAEWASRRIVSSRGARGGNSVSVGDNGEWKCASWGGDDLLNSLVSEFLLSSSLFEVVVGISEPLRFGVELNVQGI